MAATPHILVLVPDGVGIKNYLYTDVFKNRNARLTLMHSFDVQTVEELKKQLDFDHSVQIPSYREGVKEKFYRELIHKCRLKHNADLYNNPTILSNWKSKFPSFKLKLFYGCIGLYSKFIRSYQAILKLESKYDAQVRNNKLFIETVSLLKEIRPDVLFCTHQRALMAPAVFAAARHLGISTNTVIYSWDNLPKARLALKADRYLVWSDYMKRELREMYPEIAEEQILVTGTPQFDFYRETDNIIPKEVFFERYKLDKEKRLICFSGDDEHTSPDDPYYLNDLAEAIQEAGMEEEYTIVFRRCPVDLSRRYNWVLDKFPDLIKEIPPLWSFRTKGWSAVYPSYDDVSLLVSTAYYSDMVVNLGSTMAFDLGMFGKPCLYINYDQREDPIWPVKTIYAFQHFRSIPSDNAVYWLNDRSEIAEKVKEASKKKDVSITEWFDVVTDSITTASDNIFNTITS